MDNHNNNSTKNGEENDKEENNKDKIFFDGTGIPFNIYGKYFRPKLMKLITNCYKECLYMKREEIKNKKSELNPYIDRLYDPNAKLYDMFILSEDVQTQLFKLPLDSTEHSKLYQNLSDVVYLTSYDKDFFKNEGKVRKLYREYCAIVQNQMPLVNENVTMDDQVNYCFLYVRIVQRLIQMFRNGTPLYINSVFHNNYNIFYHYNQNISADGNDDVILIFSQLQIIGMAYAHFCTTHSSGHREASLILSNWFSDDSNIRVLSNSYDAGWTLYSGFGKLSPCNQLIECAYSALNGFRSQRKSKMRYEKFIKEAIFDGRVDACGDYAVGLLLNIDVPDDINYFIPTDKNPYSNYQKHVKNILSKKSKFTLEKIYACLFMSCVSNFENYSLTYRNGCHCFLLLVCDEILMERKEYNEISVAIQTAYYFFVENKKVYPNGVMDREYLIFK